MEKKEEKEQEKASPEKPFRVVAIAYRTDAIEFARDVEKALNDGHAAGFQGELSTHPWGLLYTGRLIEQAANPLREILRDILTHSQPEEGRPALSRSTHIILDTVCEGIDLDRPETFTPTLEKRVELFRRFPPDELKQSVRELEVHAATHGERCKDPTCNTPQLVMAVAEQLKKHIALQVS